MLVSQVLDSLGDARDAAGRQAWRAAYAAFGDADRTDLTAADLENYGEAAWWSGKIDEAVGHREKAFGAYSADGDTRGAARLAMTLAWDYEGKGAFAVAGGWMANAERLLADVPEAPEHGRLKLLHAMAMMFGGELDRGLELASEHGGHGLHERKPAVLG